MGSGFLKIHWTIARRIKRGREKNGSSSIYQNMPGIDISYVGYGHVPVDQIIRRKKTEGQGFRKRLRYYDYLSPRLPRKMGDVNVDYLPPGTKPTPP